MLDANNANSLKRTLGERIFLTGHFRVEFQQPFGCQKSQKKRKISYFSKNTRSRSQKTRDRYLVYDTRDRSIHNVYVITSNCR